MNNAACIQVKWRHQCRELIHFPFGSSSPDFSVSKDKPQRGESVWQKCLGNFISCPFSSVYSFPRDVCVNERKARTIPVELINSWGHLNPLSEGLSLISERQGSCLSEGEWMSWIPFCGFLTILMKRNNIITTVQNNKHHDHLKEPGHWVRFSHIHLRVIH